MPSSEPAPLAVITAGARRLGKAMCLRLAELGYDIALHHNRSRQDAETTAAEVSQFGARCELFAADFSNFEQVQQLFPAIVERFGRAPSLLINNASVFIPNTLVNMTEQEYDLDFAVHVKAPVFLTQHFAKAGTRGQIINIVDTAVVRNRSDYCSYLLSKKALYEFTRMAANELAPSIRVNAIAPGIIIPPVGIEMQKYERLAEGNLLQRKAGVGDILIALEYLLRSEQVTGECLFVDGGDHVAG